MRAHRPPSSFPWPPRSELRWAALFAAAFTLLTCLPYLLGLYLRQPGWYYSGFLTNPDDHVFLRVHAPIGPLPSSGPIAKLVSRAIDRAGIAGPSRGAHQLRHSAATGLLRQGASLDVIGALLRHRSVESTAHYSKVDVIRLRAIAQPWPEGGGTSC